MEEIALGCLGWKPDDFKKYEFKALIKACNGYEFDQKNRWERVRVSAAYSLLPWHDTKRHGQLKFKDIILPTDNTELMVKKIKNKSKGGRLGKKEIEKTYAKSGFKIREDVLNNLIENATSKN